MSIEKAVVKIQNETVKRLTAEQYSQKHGHDNNIGLSCPCCGEQIFIAAISSVRKHPYFRHGSVPDDLDCPLLEKNETRLHHLNPRNLNENQAEHLREQFYRDDNLKRAYTFMNEICGRNFFGITDFSTCVKIADGKNIWAYSGVHLWVIPYILLTLKSYTAHSKAGMPYRFRFSFQKPSKTHLDDIWLTPEKCRLAKTFDNSETLVKYNYGHENPLGMSETIYLEKSNNIGWVTARTLADLKRTA